MSVATKPYSVATSAGGHREYDEEQEDSALYCEAVERDACDDGTRFNLEEAFGENYRPVDDGFEPEFD